MAPILRTLLKYLPFKVSYGLILEDASQRPHRPHIDVLCLTRLPRPYMAPLIRVLNTIPVFGTMGLIWPPI